MSFTCTTLGAIIKFWADIHSFHFSLTIIDADIDIFASHKPQLQTLQFIFGIVAQVTNERAGCSKFGT